MLPKMYLYVDPDIHKTFTLQGEVLFEDLREVTKYVASYVNEYIKIVAKKYGIVTSAVRTVANQKAAMLSLRKRLGENAYQKIYGKLLLTAEGLSSYPHVDGRAVDFKFKGYERLIPYFQKINDEYLSGIKDVIGYTPSSLIVIELNNCFHIQIARNLPINMNELYKGFVRDLFLQP